MADQKRLLDVWIVDLNSVYREVPFNVVTDWLQQGRLMPEDRVRLAGGKGWHTLGKVPAFGPFLPKPAPLPLEDQAEALEPVDLGLHWSRPEADEDDDVDMIPLIDISLVLLIFFMMTASVSSGVLTMINTPTAKHQLGEVTKDAIWVGIEPKSRSGTVEKGPDGQVLPWVSLGLDTLELLQPTTMVEDLLDALTQAVEKSDGEIKIRLRADRSMPIEAIREVTVELQGRVAVINQSRSQSRKLTLSISGEVSEPGSK